MHNSQFQVRGCKLPVQLNGARQQGFCLCHCSVIRVLPRFPERKRIVVIRLRILRLQLDEALQFFDLLLRRPVPGMQHFPQKDIRHRIYRVQLRRLTEPLHCLFVRSSGKRRGAQPHQHARRLRIARVPLRENFDRRFRRMMQQQLRAPVEQEGLARIDFSRTLILTNCRQWIAHFLGRIPQRMMNRRVPRLNLGSVSQKWHALAGFVVLQQQQPEPVIRLKVSGRLLQFRSQRFLRRWSICARNIRRRLRESCRFFCQ